jgi:hypothetical protein
MVESVRERINEAGRALTVWAVLNEDVYEKQRVRRRGCLRHVQ